MATTTTYRQMVNRVLSSCNQPEISAAQWAQAKLEARQVKRIVAECYRDALNQMPDDHWHKLFEFTMFAPRTAGNVLSIVGDTVTGDADFQAAIAFYKVQLWTLLTYFRLTSESDWYRVETYTAGNAITLDSGTITPGVWADGVGYELVTIAYHLPTDYRDVVDVGNPLSGLDMKPVSVPEIMQYWASRSTMITASDPTHYAVGSDEHLIGETTFIKRGLWVWPVPAQDHVYHLIYQKVPVLLDYESSAATATLDLPEEALDRVLYRAKMLARMEILNDAAGAGLYRSLEKEKQRDDAAKQGSAAGMNQIQPDVHSYRGHYRNARATGGGRLIRNS